MRHKTLAETMGAGRERPKGTTMTSYQRDIHTLQEDVVLPGSGFDEALTLTRRFEAVVEVLRRLPEQPYQKLSASIDKFHWFIPYAGSYGWMQPFKATHPGHTICDGDQELGETGPIAVVLYLDPILETPELEWELVVATVAHELAHVILDHRLIIKDDVYNSQEKEVGEALPRWGFVGEAWKLQKSIVERSRLHDLQLLKREIPTENRYHIPDKDLEACKEKGHFLHLTLRNGDVVEGRVTEWDNEGIIVDENGDVGGVHRIAVAQHKIIVVGE